MQLIKAGWGVLLLVWFALFSINLQAGGMVLYSYRESSGQVVVVDSLERVPEIYRASARVEFIPSFGGAARQIKTVKPAALATPNERPVEAFNKVIDLSPRLKLKAPPPEIALENPAVASATILMEQLKLLQLNNERIHVQAVVRGVAHPIIRHLHLTNIRSLQELYRPEQITIENSFSWPAKARNFIEQTRVMQYTLSRWIDYQPDAIIKAMPPLLSQLRIQLNDLEAEFAKVLTAEKERLKKSLFPPKK